MTCNGAAREIVRVVARWLGEQSYLRSFQVDVGPYVVSVTAIANNFCGQVGIDVEPFLSREKDVEWVVTEQLETMGVELKKKLAHVADPNRLPG